MKIRKNSSDIFFGSTRVPFGFDSSPDTPGFLVQVDSDERVLQTVLQLFLVHPAGPKRLPRPSEVLFCDDKVPLAEVQARSSKSLVGQLCWGLSCWMTPSWFGHGLAGIPLEISTFSSAALCLGGAQPFAFGGQKRGSWPAVSSIFDVLPLRRRYKTIM